ncbi:hypothetical protein niasHS_007661 [Heterodera schachtii]|uniref:C2H2-type domain-containing protein n=1 Tax=Heterodera schachtii TaxID=97005 RepID=A0ABD2JPH0_HETSC
MSKRTVEQQRQQQNIQKKHNKLEQFRSKLDQIENELMEVSDQLKDQLARNEKLRKGKGEIGKMPIEREGENRLIKERISVNVAKMEQNHAQLRQNQKEVNYEFAEIIKFFDIWLRESQTHFASSLFTPTTENHSLRRQQNLKASIWAIDLFELRQFRNGNSLAQCMECGKKFMTTEEAAMGWHIVQEHPQYAAQLLQKQLERDAQQRQGTNGTETTAQKRKRKATEEHEKPTKLFRDLWGSSKDGEETEQMNS